MNTFAPECYVAKAGHLRRIAFGDLINQLILSARERRLGFFMGAGISAEYPSSLPLAAELRQYLRQMLLEQTKMDLPSSARDELEGLGLEVLLDHYCRILGENALEFYDLLKAGTYSRFSPNFRHYSAALLAKHDCCRDFLTVNFDTGIEQACSRLGVSISVPETMGENERVFYENLSSDISQSGHRLFKLHGTLDENDDLQNVKLLATVERVGIGLPLYKRKTLQKIVSARDVFFTGYNGESTDIDVFPVIARTDSDRTIFWHVHGNSPEKLDSLSRDVKQLLTQRRGYVILTKDISIFLEFLLGSLEIDYSQALDCLGLNRLADCGDREGQTHGLRELEKKRFLEYYSSKYFASPAPACLILANIMQKPGLWDIADKLLAECSGNLPENDRGLRIAFKANSAEVYRNSGKLSQAILTRQEVLEELANLPPTNARARDRISLLIRNASDHMGLFKSFAKKSIMDGRPVISRSALTNLFCAFGHFLSAYQKTKVAAETLNEFDRGTLQSMLNFEIADLFQFASEGLIYLGLLARRRSRFFSWLLISLTYFPCRIAEVFYARSVYQEPTQSSDWFYFQKHRLAEVKLQRKKKVTSDVNKLIEETEVFYRWGKSAKTAGEGNANIRVCQGLRFIYLPDLDRAISVLRAACDEYRSEKHYSGIIKARVYMGLAASRIGNMKLLSECLTDIAENLHKYE